MKKIPNYISFSRMVLSIFMIIPNTFSISFNLIYFYCGVSDVLDGYIARKTNNTSDFGSLLDSIADLMFFIIASLKILPLINLSEFVIILIIFIISLKLFNLYIIYKWYKKIMFLHSILNKITGLLLFITPFILNNDIIKLILAIVATISVIQESYLIVTKKIQL